MEKLAQRVRRAQAERQIQKLFVKIRFADFRRTTAECPGTMLEYPLYQKLLETGFQRGHKAVRLPGAGVRVSAEEDMHQLGLFGAENDTDGGITCV